MLNPQRTQRSADSQVLQTKLDPKASCEIVLGLGGVLEVALRCSLAPKFTLKTRKTDTGASSASAASVSQQSQSATVAAAVAGVTAPVLLTIFRARSEWWFSFCHCCRCRLRRRRRYRFPLLTVPSTLHSFRCSTIPCTSPFFLSLSLSLTRTHSNSNSDHAALLCCVLRPRLVPPSGRHPSSVGL